MIDASSQKHKQVRTAKCCLKGCDKPVEDGECKKHPGFAKLACTADYYSQAVKHGQKMVRCKLK